MGDEIVVYGADWCGDCRRAQRFLEGRGVPYQYVDVEDDPAAAEEARRIGKSRRIPVIVFSDGSVLVEPTDQELEARLSLLAG